LVSPIVDKLVKLEVKPLCKELLLHNPRVLLQLNECVGLFLDELVGLRELLRVLLAAVSNVATRFLGCYEDREDGEELRICQLND